jgi:hypothetical protein
MLGKKRFNDAGFVAHSVNANVRFWHLADIMIVLNHVRFRR